MLNHLSSLLYRIAMSSVALETSSLYCDTQYRVNTVNTADIVIVCIYICKALRNHSFIQQDLLSSYYVFITVLDIVDKIDQGRKGDPCPHGTVLEG